MKKTSYILLLSLLLALFSCQKKQLPQQQGILPEDITIDIPQSISYEQETLKTTTAENILNGNRIYGYLRTFIHIGHQSTFLLKKTLYQIRKYHLTARSSFSFIGQDNRTKYLQISQNQIFENKTWQYCLTIKDIQDTSQVSDSSLAFVMYWDTEPQQGICIIKPYNLNRGKYSDLKNAIFRIDFTKSSDTLSKYDKTMTVWLNNLPIDTAKRFSIQNLKMFVGQKNNRIDICGNSAHPLAWLLVPRNQPGINFAFVASADKNKDIAAVQVGLPPATLDSDNKNTILNTYSLYNVLKQEFNRWHLIHFGNFPPQDSLDAYLANAKAPAFFNSNGFFQAATIPNDNYKPLVESLNDLKPFNPKQISTMKLKLPEIE